MQSAVWYPGVKFTFKPWTRIFTITSLCVHQRNLTQLHCICQRVELFDIILYGLGTQKPPCHCKVTSNTIALSFIPFYFNLYVLHKTINTKTMFYIQIEAFIIIMTYLQVHIGFHGSVHRFILDFIFQFTSCCGNTHIPISINLVIQNQHLHITD